MSLPWHARCCRASSHPHTPGVCGPTSAPLPPTPPCLQFSNPGIDCLWERLHTVAVEAEQWPRFAVLLLSSGLLAHGLQLGKWVARETHDEPLPSLASWNSPAAIPAPAARFVVWPGSSRRRALGTWHLMHGTTRLLCRVCKCEACHRLPARPQARRLLATLVAICGNLAHECSIQLEALQGSSIGSSSGSSTGEGIEQQQQQQAEQRRQHAERLQAALAPLRQAVRQSPGPNDMLQTVPAARLPQALTNFQRGLLPAATRVAEAMQALWAAPWEQQAALLQLARAATARGCAHLRCPNLELEGAPVAGVQPGCPGLPVCKAPRWHDWHGWYGHVQREPRCQLPSLSASYCRLHCLTPPQARPRGASAAAGAGWPGEIARLARTKLRPAASLSSPLAHHLPNPPPCRYCSTACQLADWRGPLGHKRVCQALAAERQQQRGRQQPGAQTVGDA